MSVKAVRKKLIITLTGIAAACLCICGCAAKTDVRDSVVYIETGVRGPDDSWKPYAYGTGFFVGKNGTAPDTVVTSVNAADITGELYTLSASEVNAEIRVYTGSEEYIRADTAAYDKNSGTAILKLSEPAGQYVPLRLSVPYDDMNGNTVFIAGFPVSSGVPEDRSRTGAVIKEEVIGRIYTEAGINTRKIMLDGDIAGKMPGAPVTDEKGNVIGICRGTDPPGTGHAGIVPEQESAKYAESAEVIKMLMENNNIPTQAADSFPWIPVILIVVGAIIAIFIILVVIRVIVRKKNPPRITANGQGPIPTASSETSGDSGFRIECLAGALAGKRIMVKTSGALVIGGKPGMCSVALPGNPEGVGPRHCELWYNGNAVCIRDAGSTFGTFVSPERKLQPNETAELQDGDTFWLGTEAQKFAVRKKRG